MFTGWHPIYKKSPISKYFISEGAFFVLAGCWPYLMGLIKAGGFLITSPKRVLKRAEVLLANTQALNNNI